MQYRWHCGRPYEYGAGLSPCSRLSVPSLPPSSQRNRKTIQSSRASKGNGCHVCLLGGRTKAKMAALSSNFRKTDSSVADRQSYEI